MPEPLKHPEPFEIEIVVDGTVRSRFLASEFNVSETRESLKLEASRWIPSITVATNPCFDPPPPDPKLAENPLITRTETN